MYEDQTQVLKESRERQAQNEAYVVELRGRVDKLTDRNASGEVHLHLSFL